MKLEKHRYEDVVVLRFVGEFDSFNLKMFSKRIDGMLAAKDNRIVLDMRLLKFINSAALGYLIQSHKAAGEGGGEVLIAQPSKFVKKTLATLGLDGVFKIFDSVETAILHFRQGTDIGEIKLEGGEFDESLVGSTPIIFRQSGDDDAPNQVGKIVTLYGDGLLFRYEVDGDPTADPVVKILHPGKSLKLKFRQPFAVKDHYFEMQAEVTEVVEMDTDEGASIVGTRVRYDDIKDEDRQHLDEFVLNQAAWRQEVKRD